MTATNTLPLEEHDLLRAAEHSTGLSDWGPDPSFRVGLRRLIDAAEAMQPSEDFRAALRTRTVHILETRLHLADDARRYPEIEAQEISKPIAVIGLPRTGTTICYDLLTLDPAARAPREFELYIPWPIS
jgi:hypothetical protein